MVGSGAAKGAAVHERGCLTKRPLPQFAEFRAKTDDVLKIASEAAGEEIVGMPPPPSGWFQKSNEQLEKRVHKLVAQLAPLLRRAIHSLTPRKIGRRRVSAIGLQPQSVW